MAIIRTLGKNTLGDNNKIKVAMRNYDMSTHDISTVFRSTIGVGMLVPFCKILCQKGDIIDLNLINKTLSQPTLGPLFGSFKLQHFMFFGAFFIVTFFCYYFIGFYDTYEIVYFIVV